MFIGDGLIRCFDQRILLVDDEPINREIILGLLDGSGLVIDQAKNGAEAVELAKTREYGLILMDIQMPIMCGINATLEIRGIPGLESLPILALTANASEEAKMQCLDAGMDDYLTKPVMPDRLYAAVMKWLPRE
ncbi:MAG: response regulator [Azonexus sp.]|nr:response regulator [Azonexus sp.]